MHSNDYKLQLLIFVLVCSLLFGVVAIFGAIGHAGERWLGWESYEERRARHDAEDDARWATIPRVDRFTLDGHEYIQFQKWYGSGNGGGGLSVVHDPECECFIR